MNLKIKICGMTDAANMRQIARLKPAMFGLIFYPKSPRFVSIEKAASLPQFDHVNRVGVFVNESLENILTVTGKANLAFVQLHGEESPEFCAELKQRNLPLSKSYQKLAREQERNQLKIIKAFAVSDNFNGAVLKEYETVCDYFLFDTKTSQQGGSGQSFDWEILQQFKLNKPFFLAGGVGAENARAAITACAGLPLFALDINSRAEIAPGIKSPEIALEIIESL